MVCRARASADTTRNAPLDVVARLRAAGCVFAEEEADALVSTAADALELAAMVRRRVAGEPLEYIVGWVEFAGLRLAVGPGVFVPRRRTELLVREAVAAIRTVSAPIVVDMCCGVGAIGAAVLAQVPGAEVYATDVGEQAVSYARRNLAGTTARVYQGDLFAPLPKLLRGRVHVVAANVPYVPTDEIELMPSEARLYEPNYALDGGADGLMLLRRVAATAPRWLRPGGHLLVEVSARQAPTAVAAFSDAGLIARLVESEELQATAVVGARPDDQ